jgi:hypothetical protein
MSTKAVIIALVVALVLGIGAYVVLQPAPKPGGKPDVFVAGERVVKVDPGAVTAIEIETPDGEVQTIRRAPVGAASESEYLLTVGRESAKAGASWPLETGRVESLLRVLNNAPSLGAPDDKAEIDADAARVTIREENGNVTHLLIGSRTLGGKGLVKVVTSKGSDALTLKDLRAKAGKLAMMDESIHNAFRQPGPRAWRDTRAMEGIGPEVSRLQLVNADLSTKIARLEGKWLVQEPVGAPADPAQVSKLIGTLDALRITSFLDEPTAVAPTEADTSLASPLATVTTETDRRVLLADPARPAGDVTIRTETHQLFIGKPADTSGQTRYARLGKDGPVVIISGAGLTRELFDATGYVSKKAVQTTPADIGMLILEPKAPETAAAPAPGALTPTPTPTPAGRVFQRDLDKWKEVSGKTETTLDDTMTKAVGDLVKFLTSDDATSLALNPPAVWHEDGQLIVGSLGGTPLETIVLGGSDSADLVVRSGEGRTAVYRSYQRERVPRILVGMLPKPPEAVKGVVSGEKDVVK